MTTNDIGTFNKSADRVSRKYITWSDTNFDQSFSANRNPFEALICRYCDGTTFEVFGTGHYETVAKCIHCNMYYIVHNG